MWEWNKKIMQACENRGQAHERFYVTLYFYSGALDVLVSNFLSLVVVLCAFCGWWSLFWGEEGKKRTLQKRYFRCFIFFALGRRDCLVLGRTKPTTGINSIKWPTNKLMKKVHVRICIPVIRCSFFLLLLHHPYLCERVQWHYVVCECDRPSVFLSCSPFISQNAEGGLFGACSIKPMSTLHPSKGWQKYWG